MVEFPQITEEEVAQRGTKPTPECSSSVEKMLRRKRSSHKPEILFDRDG
jgi:hypothetical protein